MKEEDIDNRIKQVIKSVASKKADIATWERQRVETEKNRKIIFQKRTTYTVSAAASVAIICGVGISIYMNRTVDSNIGITSSAPIYRGSSSDISSIAALIDSAKYSQALADIDATMADTVLDPTMSAERREYLRSVQQNQNYELTWMKINVLLKLAKRQEAVDLLNDYINLGGEHQAEAKTLLDKLH